MAKYQRPCCILTRVEDDKGISYQGSARGCDRTGITEFKDICEQTECIMFAEGHQGAFGLGIEEQYLDDFINKTNEILKDTSDEAVYCPPRGNGLECGKPGQRQNGHPTDGTGTGTGPAPGSECHSPGMPGSAR